MDDGIQAQIASLDARCKSNTHRINDLETDNKALHQSNVNEIKADVKTLKALPGSRWEGLIKAVVTAIVSGLVGYALALAGLGG